jgi:hypothetical protein
MTKLFAGKLFDVVEDEGYEIVEHPGSVAIVAIDQDERVILVRQLREPARKQLLELPAGGRAEGFASPPHTGLSSSFALYKGKFMRDGGLLPGTMR